MTSLPHSNRVIDDLPQTSPDDPYNCELVGNVHPTDWVNPVPTAHYHLVVIGAGTAGLVTAVGAAGLGARVALIERGLMGGDCLNVGCVPSKSIISAARAAASVKHARQFGVSVSGEVEVDFAFVMERMRRLRARISRNDSAARLRDLGVDVFFGQASFINSSTLDVDGTGLTYKRAVIATGTRPATPPIQGLSEINSLTNETVFSLTERPRRLGIIGAGPIGCELAQAFAQLGSEVLLVESEHGILPREDRDAAEIVRHAIERDGVRILGQGRQLLLRNENGIRLSADSQNEIDDEVVDQLLIAVGRSPNTEKLNLSAVGVKYDEQGIEVNDTLQTTNPRIYAAGDVCTKYKFTHAADFMARIVIQNSLFAIGPLGKKKLSDLIIPWATYTLPEVAHVGVCERDAAEAGMQIDTYVEDFSDVDRAVLESDDAGFVKIHTIKGKDKIVGATIVARNAGDMISEITLAMSNHIGLGKIASSIHPYPTQAEAIRKLGDHYNRTRLTPMTKKMLSLLRRWNVGA